MDMSHPRVAHDPVDDRNALAAVFPLLQAIAAELRDLRAQLNGRAKSHLTVDEVAELTGRAPYTVRRWISDGRIQADRITGTGPRGRLLVARSELAKLVTSGLAGQANL